MAGRPSGGTSPQCARIRAACHLFSGGGRRRPERKAAEEDIPSPPLLMAFLPTGLRVRPPGGKMFGNAGLRHSAVRSEPSGKIAFFPRNDGRMV